MTETQTSAIIRWEDPPERTYDIGERSFDSVKASEDLMKKPGQWGVVAEQERCGYIASRIRWAVLAAFAPPGAFQATTRELVPGVVTVYARYVGPVGLR